MVSPNYLAYKNAMKQAWKDGRVSAEEATLLETLRTSLNISAEEHMQVEKELREESQGKSFARCWRRSVWRLTR